MNRPNLSHPKMQIAYKTMLTGFLLIMATASCRDLRSVPADLIGTWTTKSPEYEGAFITLDWKNITIGQCEGSVNTFTITKIKKKKVNKNWNQYTICYLDRDMQKFEFSILHYPDKTGIIRLAHKEKISWARTST